MKKILVILALFIGLQSQAQFTSATLQASGLTCAMCSKAIYKSLEKLPFAGQVQSNIKESSFTIQFIKGVVVDLDAIKNAVTAAGFSLANLKVTAQFNGEEIKDDAHLKLAGENIHFVNVKPQTLSGLRTFQVVDKNFVNDKTYKKYAGLTRLECIKTGYMQNCCLKDAAKSDSRIYHVTI
jgi:copper chaperone CopZ